MKNTLPRVQDIDLLHNATQGLKCQYQMTQCGKLMIYKDIRKTHTHRHPATKMQSNNLLKSHTYSTFIPKKKIELNDIDYGTSVSDVMVILPSVFVQTFPAMVTPSVALFPFIR